MKGTAIAQRICVTGAAGQAGRAVVRDLLEHGYDVAATDIAVCEEDRFEGMLRADLTDHGQAFEALRGTEAVVHLAAATLGVSRVVWASSETRAGVL